MISIIYGEIIQYIKIELGLLHRGSEKLIDCNYYNTSIHYFDRLDYVSTIIQELLYIGAIETFIQSTIHIYIAIYRILYIEIFRILNHLLALFFISYLFIFMYYIILYILSFLYI